MVINKKSRPKPGLCLCRYIKIYQEPQPSQSNGESDGLSTVISTSGVLSLISELLLGVGKTCDGSAGLTVEVSIPNPFIASTADVERK